MSTYIFVGARIPVCEFFWIPDNSIIGFDSDARHGNISDKSGGSVDIDSTLTVRAIANGYAIVRLDRAAMPYGALAPIGIVFQMPISQLLTWPDKMRRRVAHEKQRSELAAKYLR